MINEDKTIGLDYEKEYERLTRENSNLKKENEKYQKTILDMASLYSTISDLGDVIRDIDKELRKLSRR